MSTMSKAGSMDSVRWVLRSKVFFLVFTLAAAASLIFTVSPSKAQTTGTPSFGTSVLNGESSSQPTSLQFGPDERLYVAQQDGTIKAYTIKRNTKNDYTVTATETINNIKNIPNHDDDGGTSTATPTNKRQVTGILITGTASQPVIYVTSSDPRIGAGTSKGDVNLDTNSGVISKLTKTSGGGWNKVDLVRGLPRSEENHSQNGLQLKNNILYVTSGGHTNQGAPSTNFALLPEYALSAAILSVDLGAIGNSTYDLPTIGTSPNQPFGGNDGKNQAKLVSGGPVQVYSPGWRNAYDLLIAKSGKMYTVDNGGNSGWGDIPVGEGTTNCTNAQNEPGEENLDQLHYVSGKGYYGGHPNPTRGNKANTFGGKSPVEIAANPKECNYDKPGATSLTTYPASTNGLAEYTASNFGGAMKGDLLTAAFNGIIYRMKLNSSGDGVTKKSAEFSGFGNKPLDVTAQGDNDPFPGTVWAAVYGAGAVQVFEPDDFGGGGGGGVCDTTNPDGDSDGDGFTNSDEQANGTDPCSAASKPTDADGDNISDKTDPDDDNDGQSDKVDPFALDPDNGKTTNLPKSLTFENETSATNAGGILDLGFTGLMTNGTSDYQNLFNSENVIAGGAAGAMTVESVPEGDAYTTNNTQQNGFQFGANVAAETQPFTAHTQISGPFAGIKPQNYQAMGAFIGTGDQDNYLKIVTTANGGNGGIEVLKEAGGTPTGKTYGPADGVNILGSKSVDLYLTVDPANNTVQPSYSIDGGARKNLGNPVAIPASWLGPKALAVGVISTSNGPGSEFPATWKFIQITSGGNPDVPTEPTPVEPDPENVVHRVNAGGGALSGSTPPWSVDTQANPSPYVNAAEIGNKTASTNDTIDTSQVPGYVPMKLFQSERWDPSAVPEMKWDFPVEPGEYEVRLYFAETFDGTSSPGARLFDVDVEVEGNTVLNNYDVFENAGGHDKAVMEPISVAVEDTNLDINFAHVKENPAVKGIEVLRTGDVTPDPPASSTTGEALLEITPGKAINASTYANGAFKIKNNSADGQKIQSINIDLSTALLPDMVFDPNGTAGDETAKCFIANSDASAVGLTTQSGACGSPPFAKPHDGEVADGYDALKIGFNDFNPGETFSFSTDVDPTSIKGDPDAGGAGSVSGLELTGATVTVVYSGDSGGTTAGTTTQAYRIPASESGSQAVAKAGNITKPSISANGTAQPQTVANPSQSVKVSGPAGAQASLLVVESGLFIKQGGGYDIDPYEANSAVKITEKKTTIGQNGTVSVPVALSKSDPQAGLNYIVAVVEKDGRTGPTSNVLVMELDESQPPPPPPPDGDTTAPTVVGTTPAPGATQAGVGANATATFSEEMDASTINTNTFTLTKQGTTTPVSAAVTYDAAAKKATLNPDTDLGAGATYTATVKGGSGGVKDLAGNALANNKSWSFTTAASSSPSTYSLKVSKQANRSGASELKGATVSGNIYVFTAPDSGVSKVQFYLDDPNMSGTPKQTESVAPYDFAGGSVSTAKPFDTSSLSEGSHTITAKVVLSGGGSEVVNATFTVNNSGTAPEPTNGAPVLGAVGNQSVEEGQQKNVAVNATDPDNDSLTLTANNLPSFATFTDNGGGKGTLNIAPKAGDAGTYNNASIKATDGKGGTDTESFTITVSTTSTSPDPTPAPSGNYTIEAEEMGPFPSGVTVINDPNASGGKAIKFSQQANVFHTFNLPAKASGSEVYAKAGGGTVEIEYRLDGANLFNNGKPVSNSTYQKFTEGSAVSAGSHTLRLRAENRAVAVSSTNTLIVDKVVYPGAGGSGGTSP